MRTARLLLFILLTSLTWGNIGCGKRQERTRVVTPQPTGPSAKELFVKANKKLDAGAWKEALEGYDAALEQDPKIWEIHMNRGIALSRMGKFPESLSSFEQAIRNGGKESPEVYFNLGNLYQERGMYSSSVDCYRTALAYGQANDVDILLNLGAAYVFLRQWDNANATYNHIRSLAPDDPRAPHGLALVLHGQNRNQEAFDAYDEVTRAFPDFPLSHFNKANVLGRMKRWEEAASSMDRYVSVDPDGPYVRKAKAMSKMYRNRATKEK